MACKVGINFELEVFNQLDIANIRTYIIRSIKWHLMTLAVVSNVIQAILNIFVNYKPLTISIANMNRLQF